MKKIVINLTAILIIIMGLNYSVCMAQAVSFPKVTTLPINSDDITLTSALINGEVISDGGDANTIRGICWNTNGTPMMERNDPYKEATGKGKGLFAVEITGLTPNKIYYVRTYAKNSRTGVYGGELSFKTKTDVPTVTTSDITDIGSINAMSGGEVVSENGSSVTARGICWSISENPTVIQPDPFTQGEWGITKDGGGLGKFTSSVTGLSRGITYYLRAYSTNSVGTGYGEKKIFTTLNTPVVITESAEFISRNTISAEGSVTDDGGHPVTARGFCWSISANPTLTPPATYAKGEWGTTSFSSAGTGFFTGSGTGLISGKQYYIRAYSANSVGTSYGNQIIVSPRVIYVKKDATGNNDGTSWQNAFTNLQTAITNTSDGNDIWVAGGTYKPSNDRYSSFQLKTGVEIYGGFDGTESDRDDRKPGNPSILSGDIGIEDNLKDNSFHVVTGSNTDSTAVLDGFTITKGNANGSEPYDRGAGIFIDKGSPTISSCIFTENIATMGGAGIFNGNGSNPLITRCTFTKNSTNTGGGICNMNAGFTIINSTFYKNTVSYAGGGIYSDIGDIIITNCTFSSNIADNNDSGIGFGGGIYIESDETLITVKNTLIADNKKGTLSPKADDCYNEDGVIDSAGYNLVENGCASWFDNTGDIIGEKTALNLKLLAENGGFTPTCGLSADSPAIDAGNNINVPDKDQRGYSRNGATDIGAFEFIGPRITTVEPYEISDNSALSGGKTISDNGAAINAKGVCWSLSSAQTLRVSKTLRVYSDAICSSDGTGSQDFSSSISGLTPGTKYYVRAYAVNQDGTSYGNELFFKTVPATPVVNSASNIKTTEFTARWYSAEGADKYHLDLSTSSDFKTFVTGYEDKDVGKVTSYNITGLTSDTTYYYRIRAVNDGGSGENSEIITVLMIPSAPKILPASDITANGFTANWSESAGADDYRLDVSSSKIFNTYLTGYRDLSVGKETSRKVTDLTSGTAYYYRIRAVNASGTGANSEVQTVITTASPTTANAAINISENSFTANWKAATGAESYRLDISLSENFSTYLKGYNDKTVTGINETVTGLIGGTAYYYRVRVVNTGGTTENSNVIKVLTFPPAPKILPASDIYSDRFTAHWDASVSAESYILDVSSSKDFSTFITGYKDKIINALSNEVIGLNGNTNYYYVVRAMNNSGVSGRSQIQEVKTALPAPKAIKASEFSANGFTVNWEPLANVDSYYLDISTSDDFSSFVTGYENFSVKENSRSITGLTPGTLYYYRVRAANAAGTSENSNIIEAITIPPAPTAYPASDVNSTGFTAKWETTNGAEKYLFDLSMEQDFSNYIRNYENISVTGTSQIITGLVPATSYYYRIRAVNAGGISQNSSVANVTTAPPAPVITEATEIKETGFVANWNPTPTAKSYRIDVSPANDFSEYVKSYENLSVNETSQRVIGLTPGTKYYYRIRGVSSNGISVNSDTGTVKTLAVVPTVITNDVSSIMPDNAISGGEIIRDGGAAIISRGICWSRSENPTITTGVNIQDTSSWTGVFTISITGLEPETTYYVRAYAENQVGLGYGDQKSFKTIDVPVVTTSAITDINSVSASGGGNVTDNRGASVTERGICWSKSSEPGLENGAVCSSQGTGLGIFAVSITGLSPHNTYYVRAYAVNKAGTGYGEERSFSTITTPTVITADVSNITSTTAFCGGDVTDNGGSSVTARGVCWSKSPVQTIEDSGAICSSDGTGEGTFTHSVTGLMPDTTYYIRAYASNIIGKYYGNEVSFKTLLIPGDINADGKVNPADAIIGLQILSGIEPDVMIHSNADADNDGKISLGDVVYILRKSLGL